MGFPVEWCQECGLGNGSFAFDPTRIYDMYNWSGAARREGLSHNQITDKVFEENSILCLERYIPQYSPSTQRREPQPKNGPRKRWLAVLDRGDQCRRVGGYMVGARWTCAPLGGLGDGLLRF
jgi:hypothetical protein